MAIKSAKTKDRGRWKRILVRLAIAVALVMTGLSWPAIMSGKGEWIEAHYSETIYQTIRRAISAANSLVPWSIAEFLLYGLTLGAAVLLIVRIVQLCMRRIPFRRFAGFAVSLLLAAGVILNLFYVTWGFNYFREPLYKRMELEVKQRSVDELESFVLKTAAETRELRASLDENEAGVFSPAKSVSEVFDQLPDAYVELSRDYPVFQPDVTRAKQVFWSRGLSWQGISGVYIGITAEPNVNIDQPPLLVYQAAAHEMAHQNGIASENEAEFTAYLACRYSDDPNVRYSGLIYALIVSGNALYDADSERYLVATEQYGDAIWRDLQAYNAYWDAFDGEARQSADRRNDAYLKHNSQPSGIKSYGESVDLLLAFAAKYGI